MRAAGRHVEAWRPVAGDHAAVIGWNGLRPPDVIRRVPAGASRVRLIPDKAELLRFRHKVARQAVRKSRPKLVIRLDSHR